MEEMYVSNLVTIFRLTSQGNKVYAVKLPISSAGSLCNSILTICILLAHFNQIELGRINTDRPKFLTHLVIHQ